MSHEKLNGRCPVPFLQETLFPSTGGYIRGRYCTSFPASDGPVSCCVPCPADTWRFSDVIQRSRIANWMGVAALPLPVFLLVTYVMLPIKWTGRTWFAICVSLSCLLMEIAFVVPLGGKQNECYNEITPNDMNSDLACAFSGSLIAFSGCSLVVWVFIRTIGFHLQVCWDIRLGRRFTWFGVACGAALIVVITTLVLCLSGVSYRFGETCVINSHNSAWDFWIPVLAITAISLSLHSATVTYCLRVYLRSLNANSSALGSRRLSSSFGPRIAYRRQAYSRVREVLLLQWRGIGLIFVVMGHVVFVAVIFLMGTAYDKDIKDSKNAQAWVSCLSATGGDKQQCLPKVGKIGPGEVRVAAALCLLSLVGFWNILLLTKWSMIRGWHHLFRQAFSKHSDFVSVDSLTASQPYEMTPKSALLSANSPPESEVRPPSPVRISESPKHSGLGDGHFGQEARYFRPSMSFSTPRPPKSWQGREWDPEATFAPSFSQGYIPPNNRHTDR